MFRTAKEEQGKNRHQLLRGKSRRNRMVKNLNVPEIN